VKQLEEWTEDKPAGVKVFEQCDFVEARSTSNVYQRTCANLEDACAQDMSGWCGTWCGTLVDMGVPCGVIKGAWMAFWIKILHYAMEIMFMALPYRWWRKRTARRAARGHNVERYPKVNGGYCCLLIVITMSFPQMMDSNTPMWPMIHAVLVNDLFFEPVETFVSNAIGVADCLVAGGPDC
jgi:hypothetical protein